MEDKIIDLAVTILRSKNIPEHYNFLLISDGQWIRVSHGIFEKNSIPDINTLTLDRGKILDIFSKLEYLVNALIRSNLMDLLSEKGLILDEILVYVDFFSRLKILKDWDIIDDKLFGLLMETKQVRNGFAHSWGYYEVRYKGKGINANFDEFKKNMNEIWERLLIMYEKKQEQIDIESIKKEIEQMNKSEGIASVD